MANNFQIVISAVNQASGPLSQVQRSVRNLGSQINSSKISSIGNAFSGGGGGSALSKFLPLAGPLLAIVAMDKLIGKIAEFESKWATSGRAMGNLGVRTGLPSSTVSGVTNAVKLSGGTSEQAASGIEQLRQTYSDAAFNRNPEAMRRFQTAGISTNPEHLESIESVMTKLAAYAEVLRKQGKYGGAQNFLNGAGAGQLIDFLDQGPRQVASDLKAGHGLAMTQQDIDRAREYARSTAQLSVTYDRLKNTIGSGIEPYLNDLLRVMQVFADGLTHQSSPDTKRVHSGLERFGNVLRGNGDQTMAELQQNGPDPSAPHYIERFGNWLRGNGSRSNAEVAAEPNANVPRAISYFEQHGSTHEQAIGKTANLLRESGLDPSAEGDNGNAYGIAQWHKDRQAEFQKWSGFPIQQSTLEQQLGFMDHELRSGSETAAGNALNQTTSAREAAEIVSRQFERPANGDAEAAERGRIAAQLAAIYGGSANWTKRPVDDETPTATTSAATTNQGDDQQQRSGPVGRGERMKIEIVHKNAPAGSSVNVSAPSSVDASLTTDRPQTPLGGQYAYSGGNF